MPNQHVALANVQPLTILDRYLSDERTVDIAKTYGVTSQALGKHLLKLVPDQWQEAQVARAVARKDRAEEDLEDLRNGGYRAKDGELVTLDAVSLACARERLKAAQWDLERVCRRIYGANVELTGAHGKDLIPEQNIADVARKVAFLLRKGVEAEDAEVIDQASGIVGGIVVGSIEDKT